MMAADQFHRQGWCACLAGQVRTPPGMMRSHDEWQAPSMRSPCSPAQRGASEQTFSQHNHGTVEDGKGYQDFSHIVQESRRQQFRCNLPGSLQALEYLIGMYLFRRLHPPEEDKLCRI